MPKTFICEVHTANKQVFEVTYQSTKVSEGEAFKPFNIIREVKLLDYVLALGQLREKEIWHEIMAAVDNNSYSQWEGKFKPASNLHPVFEDIFNSIASATKPNFNQVEDVANISQQGNQC